MTNHNISTNYFIYIDKNYLLSNKRMSEWPTLGRLIVEVAIYAEFACVADQLPFARHCLITVSDNWKSKFFLNLLRARQTQRTFHTCFATIIFSTRVDLTCSYSVSKDYQSTSLIKNTDSARYMISWSLVNYHATQDGIRYVHNYHKRLFILFYVQFYTSYLT